jgi:hypothetical protein
MVEVAGLGGLGLSGLNIWAIMSIVSSYEATAAQVPWTLLVPVMPVAGFIIWPIVGPRSQQAAS